MNDLMTKSFLSYVELKRQALRDLEDGDRPAPASPDAEEEERQLIRFYEEVGSIQQEMEHISCLLLEIRHLIEETPTARGAKARRGLRDRVDSGVAAVLRGAGDVRSRLAALDRHHRPSAGHGGGGAVRRARSSVTRALRAKLGEMMAELRRLRERSTSESVEAGHLDAGGGAAGGDAAGEPTRSAEGEERAAEGREGAAGELQQSLERLRGVFADMAALVDGEGEQLEDIEGSVARAGVYIGGGTGRLAAAARMRRREARWGCIVWVGALLLVSLLTCLVLMFTGS